MNQKLNMNVWVFYGNWISSQLFTYHLNTQVGGIAMITTLT
jgi:hypothetical protein